MFKVKDIPLTSDFGKHPRSLQEAFKGVDYGCAIEAPTKRYTFFKRFLSICPKLIWVVSLFALVSILINL